MLDGYKSCHVKDVLNLNYLKIPVNRIDVDKYNELVEWCRNQPDLTEGIERTRSGGISLKRDFMNKWSSTPRITRNGNCIGAELLIIMCRDAANGEDLDFFCGRFQIGTFQGTKESEKHICGRQAYFEFKKILEKNNIDLNKYMLPTREQGIKIKKTIQNPMIDIAVGAFPDVIYENAWHIDINSSYPSGIGDIIPEMAPIIEKLYRERHTKSINKDILNMSIGFFQSSMIDYKLSYISEHCIRKNNERLSDKAIELIKKGCKILLYNTDGFWFIPAPGLKLESSTELGEFKIDHKNCKLRIKSKGVYEYIENGVYFPVVRGQCELDHIKSRSEWKWGDIYAAGAKVIIFEFIKETGKIGKSYLEDVEV